MSAKSFLDTNIFLYSFDDRAPIKAKRAIQLVREAVVAGTGVVSYQVVQEFFNVALRRFTPPMTSAEAEQYLASIFRPLWAIHSSPSLFAAALDMQRKYRLSWYDSLIVAAASEAECSLLYTEDLHHGARFGSLRVENPFR